jgi:hypothetical protein
MDGKLSAVHDPLPDPCAWPPLCNECHPSCPELGQQWRR